MSIDMRVLEELSRLYPPRPGKYTVDAYVEELTVGTIYPLSDEEQMVWASGVYAGVIADLLLRVQALEGDDE